MEGLHAIVAGAKCRVSLGGHQLRSTIAADRPAIKLHRFGDPWRTEDAATVGLECTNLRRQPRMAHLQALGDWFARV
ncbi:hypothetical protein GCM10028792_40920 [Salinisphaera aquimarina]